MATEAEILGASETVHDYVERRLKESDFVTWDDCGAEQRQEYSDAISHYVTNPDATAKEGYEDRTQGTWGDLDAVDLVVEKACRIEGQGLAE